MLSDGIQSFWRHSSAFDLLASLFGKIMLVLVDPAHHKDCSCRFLPGAITPMAMKDTVESGNLSRTWQRSQ